MWSAATLMSIEFMESSKYTARAALRAWLWAARRCMYRPTKSQPDAPKNAPIAAEISCSKLMPAVSALLQRPRSAQHEIRERNQLVLGRRRRRQRDRRYQLARAHEDRPEAGFDVGIDRGLVDARQAGCGRVRNRLQDLAVGQLRVTHRWRDEHVELQATHIARARVVDAVRRTGSGA